MLEVRHLACVRGDRLLFRGLCAAVSAGQVLRVSGANGAGKTSLLRIFGGMLLPAAGEVLWRGIDVRALADAGDLGRAVCYVGHQSAVKDDLSASENLCLSVGLQGATAGPEDAARALDEIGLKSRMHEPVQSLSQGLRRRVALARLALRQALPAPLWILDEPFNALDRATCAWLARTLEAHSRRGGISVLTGHQEFSLAASVPQAELVL